MHSLRLREIQTILKTSKSFNQTQYWSDFNCGTPGCIAGHAYVMYSPITDVTPIDLHDKVMTILDLTDRQADELFAPRPYGWSSGSLSATSEEAIGAIQSLIDTGVVKWPER